MAQNSRKLIAALAPWNAWEGPLSHTGIDRDITTQLLHLIGRPEALVLTGIRRSGKSTIMLQLIEALVSQGNDRKSILYVNFEEPTLDTRQGVELLEDIYLAFREILWPAGHATLFLDEIQYVNEWEKWVNARLRTEDVDIIVSGSSAQLMSREIATLLTGRNITVRIFPLSFSEFLRFRGVDGSIEDISISKDRHRFRHELSNYLQWGAFPEAALEKSEAIRSRLLSQYLDDILFKDVVIRHQIRDARLLRDMAIYLLTHTACRMTLQSLRKTFGISLDMARSYLDFLQEPYLIGEVRKYARSLKTQQIAARKIYSGDLGLRQIASLSRDEDIGRLQETAVFHVLERSQKHLFFLEGKEGEIDFLLCKGLKVEEMIQVTFSDLSEKKTRTRELVSLRDTGLFPDAQRTLITDDWPNTEIPEQIKNHLLGEWLFSKEVR